MVPRRSVHARRARGCGRRRGGWSGASGSATAGVRSVRSSTRRADWAVPARCAAAAGRGRTASNEPRASSANIPRNTPESVPPETAGTETTRTPTTASPASAVTAPSANADTSAVRRRWRSSAPSQASMRAAAASAAPNATSSGAPASASTSSADRRARAGDSRREAALAAVRPTAGSTTPAVTSEAARTSAAAGRATAAIATASAPASRATAIGPAARSHRFWSSSTSATKRESRSPVRTPGRPPGTSGSRRANRRARIVPSARRVASCPESRSRYRRTARETPKKRTATIATESSRIGGCCAAREMR